MNNWILGISCLLAAMTIRAGEQEFRAFTSADGRTLEARIVEHDSKKGKIKIERHGARAVWVAPDVFGAADQAYIKDWVVANNFLSPVNLMITLSLKEKKSQGNHTAVKYELTFLNKGSAPVEIHGYEYLCLVERNAHEKKSDRVRMWGRWESKEALNLQTGKHTHELRDSLILDEENYKEEIKGIWIRMKGPSLDGRIMCRDLCLPLNFVREFNWVEVRENARENLLNPELGEALWLSRKNGGKPTDAREYRRWFFEIQADIKNHSEAGKRAEARSCYIELVALYDPEYEDDRGSMAAEIADCARRIHDMDAVLKWYETALRVGDEENWRRLIVEILTSGDPKFLDVPKAIEYAKLLIKKDKKNPEYYKLLARAYGYDGNFLSAIKAQKDAISRAENKRWPKGSIDTLRTTLTRYEKGQGPINFY